MKYREALQYDEKTFREWAGESREELRRREMQKALDRARRAMRKAKRVTWFEGWI